MTDHPESPVDPGVGRLFEDFRPGEVIYHPFGRTVTEADNQTFTLMTQNVARIHLDRHFAARTEFGRTLVNSTFTLALVTGQSTIDLSTNVFANLGWDEVRTPHPVFEGDTIYSRSKVLAARESASRPAVGVVTVATEGFNQDGVVVISYRRTLLVYRRGHQPTATLIHPDEASLPAVGRRPVTEVVGSGHGAVRAGRSSGPLPQGGGQWGRPGDHRPRGRRRRTGQGRRPRRRRVGAPWRAGPAGRVGSAGAGQDQRSRVTARGCGSGHAGRPDR